MMLVWSRGSALSKVAEGQPPPAVQAERSSAASGQGESGSINPGDTLSTNRAKTDSANHAPQAVRSVAALFQICRPSERPIV